VSLSNEAVQILHRIEVQTKRSADAMTRLADTLDAVVVALRSFNSCNSCSEKIEP